MSNRAITWALTAPTRTAVQRLVLIVLANRADDDGVCWPSVARIMAETMLKRRAVQIALADLADAGIITRERRKAPSGVDMSDKFTLAIGRAHDVHPRAHDMRGEGACGARGRAHDVHPNPKREPKEEPTLSFDHPHAEPEAPAVTRSGPSPSEKRAALVAEFDASFWPAYPLKVGKGQARKAYLTARGKAPLADMLAAIERYRRFKPPDRAYCHASTWLNGERWTDQHDENRQHHHASSRNGDRPSFAKAIATGLAGMVEEWGGDDARGRDDLFGSRPEPGPDAGASPAHGQARLLLAPTRRP